MGGPERNVLSWKNGDLPDRAFGSTAVSEEKNIFRAEKFSRVSESSCRSGRRRRRRGKTHRPEIRSESDLLSVVPGSCPGWIAAPRPAEAGDSLSIQHAAAHPWFCTRARLNAYPAETAAHATICMKRLRLQTCVSIDLCCISIIHVFL